MAFGGFSEKTIDFFWGIRLNNERSWYQAHKDECRQYLTGPMNELANLVMEAFDEARPDLDLTVHMSRIYRDARRLYGKGPYKDYLWFTLHDAACEHFGGRPSFWFEISADSWGYGMGCYDERTGFMKKVRKKIESDPAGLRDLDALLSSQSEFVLEGDEYKKQYRDCPVEGLGHWYRKKNISISHNEPVGPVITGEEFGRRIAEGLLWLAPFYDYFYPIAKASEEEEQE